MTDEELAALREYAEKLGLFRMNNVPEQPPPPPVPQEPPPTMQLAAPPPDLNKVVFKPAPPPRVQIAPVGYPGLGDPTPVLTKEPIHGYIPSVARQDWVPVVAKTKKKSGK
jgi:hypothetical protein